MNIANTDNAQGKTSRIQVPYLNRLALTLQPYYTVHRRVLVGNVNMNTFEPLLEPRKRCDSIVPRYNVPEYLQPGQGYFFLAFMPSGGPFTGIPGLDKTPFYDLPVVFEEEEDEHIADFCHFPLLRRF